MKANKMGRLTLVCLLFASGYAMAADRYVATNGLHQTPYTSWATAATNIQTAITIAAVGETVWVSNGVYGIKSTITISKNIAIRSLLGQTQTIIDGSYTTTCIQVSATPNCIVDGFTIRNGRGNYYPGGIYIAQCRATFTNCIITANRSTNNLTGGGGVGDYLGTGMFVNCVISYNTNTTPSGGTAGGGIYLSSGLLSNCWIIGNYCAVNAGGAYLGAVTAANCVITGNYCAGGAGGGGGYSLGARIVNSLIAGNTSISSGGFRIGYGTYMGNCTINSNVAKGGTGVGGAITFYSQANPGMIENCEIRGNSNIGTGSGIIYMYSNAVVRGCLIAGNVVSNNGVVISANGSNLIQNCTIANNSNVKPATTNAGLYLLAKDRVENTICYSNKDPSASSARNYTAPVGCVITYSCTIPDASSYGAGNMTNDPLLADVVGGNYRLQNTSPCINTGSNQAWMSGAKDLDGNPRLDSVAGLVDMGAYEYVPTMNAVSGMSGGNVTYTYQIGLSEVKVSDYVQYLNAAETNGEITVSTGQVVKAGTYMAYCLTQAADTNAPVVYNSGLPAGQRFTAITSRTNHPIVFVSWFGAAAYCNWKSDQEGFVKVYNPAGGWTAALTNNGYRLPTEKEWRKAAAWSSSSNSFYAYGTSKNTMTNTDANYLFSGDSYETNVVATCPVNAYTPSSPYWLKDASGNVWEWCQDFYDNTGYDADVDAHAVRGGSWGNLPTDVRAASRSGLKPGFCAHTVGFRVARTSP